MKKDTAKEQKKAYQKPEIAVIDLAADEVLAAGCKSPTGSGNPALPNCLNASCASIGS
jgi:hypothetical protein